MNTIPRPPGELSWADRASPAPTRTQRVERCAEAVTEALELAKGVALVIVFALVAVRVLG